MDPSYAADRPAKVRVIQQSHSKQWMDFSFTTTEWPNLKVDNSPFQLMLLEGYTEDRSPARQHDLLQDVAHLVDIPPTLMSNHLWAYSNWGQAYAISTEWSDDTPDAYMTKHTSMAMFSVVPPIWSNAKSTDKDEDGDEQMPYVWYFVRIFCLWELRKPVKVAVIDFPGQYADDFINAIKMQHDLASTPYILHTIALCSVIDFHLEYLKGISWHTIRVPAEENDNNEESSFLSLYWQEQFCTDLQESLEVAMDTIQHILKDHEKFYKANSSLRISRNSSDGTHQTPVIPSKSSFERIQNELEAHYAALQGFHKRAAALGTRTQSRIALSRNDMIQRDTRASVQLARISTRDSAAMKVIAFVTVLFLPATFVSAIFGTNFFIAPQGKPYGDPNRMQVSSNFWIYWAFAVPLTLLCAVGGLLWHERSILRTKYAILQERYAARKVRVSRDEERAATQETTSHITREGELRKRSTGLSARSHPRSEKRGIECSTDMPPE